MPKHLTARPPLDATEERHVRKLAHSMHAPADWIFHAQDRGPQLGWPSHSPDCRRVGLPSADGAGTPAGV